jgi:hypothetical protein
VRARRAGARDVAARQHPSLDMLLVPYLNAFSPKICTGVQQVMNTKVLDLAILYNMWVNLINGVIRVGWLDFRGEDPG